MDAAGVASRVPGRGAGRLQTILVIVVGVIVVGTLAYVASGPAAADGVTTVDIAVSGKAPAVGDIPPAFTATTYDGTQVSLADYAGKPVWLTFGASWCPDCRTEAPDLEATYLRYKDQGLNVLGVFIGESAADISAYAGRAGLTFPIAVDQADEVASAYQTLGIPTHFFIGADGRIEQIRIGALSKDDMDRAAAALVD
ncbi:MAG TPA: TlpA disulfide reductase family protein [Candidatus Limnocylindrales bacterium]|jgi:peroxiredoxin|nr:TlpA disulfide reductase family protein [Candidatus Limnocylindrales bacterium]